MAHDVFISYSNKNKNIADAVCSKLEQDNIRCWMAPRDITPGEKWAKAICDAIESSAVMVLIFSTYIVWGSHLFHLFCANRHIDNTST